MNISGNSVVPVTLFYVDLPRGKVIGNIRYFGY